MTNCIITIPKTIPWETYQQELDASLNENMILNYRVSFKPKVEPGDKCFVVHNEYIRGYQIIVGVVYQDEFICEITGQIWPKGWYIQRSGPFYPTPKILMNGFRGIRYITKEFVEKMIKEQINSQIQEQLYNIGW